MVMAWFDVFVIIIEFSVENGQPESINCRSKSDQIPIRNVKNTQAQTEFVGAYLFSMR